MKHRPWPITIIALLHLLEPFIRLYRNSLLIETSVWGAFQYSIDNWGLLSTIVSLSCFPLAGMAIYSFKRWSLLVFLGIQFSFAAINIDFILQLYALEKTEQFNIFVATILVNLVVTSYFLIPSVAKVYFDPRYRWWESKSRFFIDSFCEFVNLSLIGKKNLLGKGNIKDVSETGVFLTTETHLKQGDNIVLKFHFHNLYFLINGVVVHYISSKNGYGVVFKFFDQKERERVKSLIRALKLLNSQETRPLGSSWDDFTTGIVSFFTTGKGLFPEFKSDKNRNKVKNLAEYKNDHEKDRDIANR